MIRAKDGWAVQRQLIKPDKVERPGSTGEGAKKRGKKAAAAKKSKASGLPVQLKSKTDVVKELIAEGLIGDAQDRLRERLGGHLNRGLREVGQAELDCFTQGISPFSPAGDAVSKYAKHVDYQDDTLKNCAHFSLPSPVLLKFCFCIYARTSSRV